MAAEMLDNTVHLVSPPDDEVDSDTEDPYFIAVMENAYKGCQELYRGTRTGPKPDIKPAPIHDLESFFWVLCWICVMREGPSTPRQPTSQADKMAIQAGASLFENSKPEHAAYAKRKLLTNNKEFKHWSYANVAPYFCFLLPTLGRLAQHILKAHETRQFDGVHDAFVDEAEIFLNQGLPHLEREKRWIDVLNFKRMKDEAMERKRKCAYIESPPRVPPRHPQLPPEPELPTPNRKRTRVQ